MKIQERKKIRYYLDEVAEELTKRYNVSKLIGPHGLTGDYMEECAVLPFLLAARNIKQYGGFDFEGYEAVRNLFTKVMKTETEMVFARATVKSEEDLAKLADKGHLRRVRDDGILVYFPSERLIRRSIKN